MATSPIHQIYTNPSARTWVSNPLPSNTSEIQAFYNSLPNFAPTPLIPLPAVAKELGLKAVYVKAETSRLGLPSFKLLGVSWAIRQAIIQRASLRPSASLEDLRAAVIKHGIKLCAATDGNHGRAVARMGMLLGVKEIKIFVPRGLDESIVRSIEEEGKGVEVLVVEGCYDVSVKVAHRWGEDNQGGMLIEGTAFEGYEDVPKWTVQGYRSMLYEIDSQLNGQVPSLVVAPVGVGSLAQAIVTHYKAPKSLVSSSPVALPPDSTQSSSSNRPSRTSILTVEPRTAASLHASLHAGTSLTITTAPTIMTGLECGTISTAAWPILKEGVDASITVGDREVHRAVKDLEMYGAEAGPCGAAALAGLREVFGWVRGENGMGREVREVLGLGGESVVVLICTEGRRPYAAPVL
ncbi:pyridoxal-phosphate dependent enzyme-domain-containing protein [Cadophora sp. MPI-SDFR-AT-0126]|nr:pyridoxal-phosphate dependent enzyme-domain-containing protein [Leotiomycetes sp. MPI-SDFR-AT-0126]